MAVARDKAGEVSMTQVVKGLGSHAIVLGLYPKGYEDPCKMFISTLKLNKFKS